jgi:hypothetical protein
MRARAFNILAVSSVLLAVASAGLWAWTLFASARADYASHDARRGVFVGWVISSSAGEIFLARTSGTGTFPHDRAKWHRYTVPLDPEQPLRLRLGLRLPRFDYRDVPIHPPLLQTYWSLTVPYWLLVLIAVPLPAAWRVRRARVRRRLSSGQCLHCGYDLRATPERCPECGRGTMSGP